MIRNLRTNKFDGTKNKDTYDDLLVFGYHCKLFRNDEGALNTDLGRHLIPWAGDSSVTIDRYIILCFSFMNLVTLLIDLRKLMNIYTFLDTMAEGTCKTWLAMTLTASSRAGIV